MAFVPSIRSNILTIIARVLGRNYVKGYIFEEGTRISSRIPKDTVIYSIGNVAHIKFGN